MDLDSKHLQNSGGGNVGSEESGEEAAVLILSRSSGHQKPDYDEGADGRKTLEISQQPEPGIIIGQSQQPSSSSSSGQQFVSKSR
jgi:hypothetical protein